MSLFIVLFFFFFFFFYFLLLFFFFFFFFFFQAEDGIRDRNVTGVQTCALPICARRSARSRCRRRARTIALAAGAASWPAGPAAYRRSRRGRWCRRSPART